MAIGESDSIHSIEGRATRKVLDGKFLVCSYETPRHERAAVVPLRFGSPRILVVVGGIKKNLGQKCAVDPSSLARKWRYEFDPKTDLVLSIPKSKKDQMDLIIDQLVTGTYPNLASWRRNRRRAAIQQDGPMPTIAVETHKIPMEPQDRTPLENIALNAKNPETKAFLDELYRLCKTHNLMVDRETKGGRLWIREWDDDDQEFIYSATDTTQNGSHRP